MKPAIKLPIGIENFHEIRTEDFYYVCLTTTINSNGNSIIRTLLKRATDQTMEDLDQLVNGLTIPKKINEELTYRELYDSIDNLWSVLFATGRTGP